MRRVLLALLLATGACAQGPKVLVIYDMEGISGITRQSYTMFGSADYPQGRAWLTSDVNAAVRGVKAGGAGAVWIQDGHGSGNSAEPDLLVAKLDPGGRFDFRDRDFDPYSTGLDGSLAAIVCIGMHARANTGGFLAHTYTLEPAFRVNGVEITETQIIALSAARWGVPVIMVSGDDVLESQLRPEFPDLEYAVVKTAKSRALAEAIPQEEVQRRIEDAARKAMEKLRAGGVRAYYMQPPFTFELTFQNATQAERAMNDKQIERAGEKAVRFRAPTFVEGYEFSKHLISLSIAERFLLLMRAVQHHPDGPKIMEQFRGLIMDRWLEPEKLPDWARDPAPAPPRKRFFGAN